MANALIFHKVVSSTLKSDKEKPVTHWSIDSTSMIAPLIDRLAQEKPIAHGLAVGLESATSWIGEWQSVTVNELETWAFTKRYDLAVIGLFALNYGDKSILSKPKQSGDVIDADNLDSSLHHHAYEQPTDINSVLIHGLTRLRDLLARRVLVLAIPEFTPLLRSLGFSQIEHIEDANIIIWQFNILSYKQVPDWLNSKYWANPENWGKYRW